MVGRRKAYTVLLWYSRKIRVKKHRYDDGMFFARKSAIYFPLSHVICTLSGDATLRHVVRTGLTL
jgi:hypothetical protein